MHLQRFNNDPFVSPKTTVSKRLTIVSFRESDLVMEKIEFLVDEDQTPVILAILGFLNLIKIEVIKSVDQIIKIPSGQNSHCYSLKLSDSDQNPINKLRLPRTRGILGFSNIRIPGSIFTL